LDLRFWIARFAQGLLQSKIQNLKSKIELLVFPVQPMAAAAATELVHFQPVGRVFLVLRRHVIPLFALGALQNYIISRHKNL
jgi:hypothetical protein